jgi:hypothetical protein
MTEPHQTNSLSDKKARIGELLTIRKDITSFFRKRSEELKAIKECRVVPTDFILEFSRYTTFTLRAPEGWTPGMPLIGGHPPAPQPDQMRDGVLQRHNQQRPIIIAPPPVVVMKEMKHIVKVELRPKVQVNKDDNLVPQKVPAATEQVSIPIAEIRNEKKAPIRKIDTPVDGNTSAAASAVVDQQPHKRARQINISFGLSDSESSDDDADS